MSASAKPPGRHRRPGRALWLAAAIVVVVAGLAAAVVATRDDTDRTRTGPPADEPRLPGPADDPILDTGWYLPPEGWTVTDVERDFLDVGESSSCPYTVWTAARPGDGPALVTVAESGVPDERIEVPGPTEPVDVGGREGTVVELSEGGVDRTPVWVDRDGRRILADGRAVGTDVLVALVDGWADQVDRGEAIDVAALPLPDGFVATALGTKVGAFEHLLSLTAVEDDTGAEVSYQVAPTGYLRGYLDLATVLGGADGTIVGTGESGDDGRFAVAATGRLDVVVGPDGFGGAASTLSTDALAAFLAGLHEVTVEEWRAALPSDAPDEVVDAPTLYDPPLTG